MSTSTTTAAPRTAAAPPARRTPRRRGRLLALTSSAALGLLVATPLAAQAHVEIEADSTAAGSVALLTLEVPHGCDGEATTAIEVRIPDGVVQVTPTVNPGWRLGTRREQLATPVTDDDGETITSRVGQVSWRARTPLPDGFRDTLTMRVLLPEGGEGQQLVFPTIQSCGPTEVGWTQVGEQGASHDDLEHPAPTIVVTAATAGSGDHHAADAEATSDDHADDHDATAEPSTGTTSTDTATSTGAAAAVASGGSTSTVAVAGLVLGALGLGAGATALARTRHRRD